MWAMRLMAVVVVLAVAPAARAQADAPGTLILSDVTARACSAAMADEWQTLRTDGHFIARGDRAGRVRLYATPADAAAGVNPEKAYLVDGDFVEQPAADTDDWTALSTAAAQSMPPTDAVTGKPDLRLSLEQEADPAKAGIADCIRYQRAGRRPVFGWVRPGNLGALPQHFSQMDAADQAAFRALAPMRWPAHVGGDGRDDGEGGVNIGFEFYTSEAAFRASHSKYPGDYVETLVAGQRWLDDGDDDCGFSIYLLNQAVYVPPTAGDDCWGNHGQGNPAGAYDLR